MFPVASMAGAAQQNVSLLDMNDHIPLGFVLFIAVLISGCSTLELQDTYIATETKKDVLIDLKQDDAELRVGINPKTRFYSIGVLGIPVIPTYVKPTAAEEILLGISLTLRHERGFSFAARPCLNIEKQNMLCPYEVEISAVGLFQDDGSRWQKISNFYNLDNQLLRLAIAPTANRVDQQLIYQHYNYSGTPEFGYLRVSLTYKYQCTDGCPERMSLDTNGLVALENVPIEARYFHLEKAKQSDYRPTARVQ